MQTRSLTVLISGLILAGLGACGSDMLDETQQSHSALTTACAATWTAETAYVAGSTVSIDNVNYKSYWWTQGENPTTNNGVQGSGKPWELVGACSSSTTTPSTETNTDSTVINGVVHPNLNSKLCLAVDTNQTANGSAVKINTCDGSSAQAWRYDNGQLKIFSNKCLDVVDGVMKSGTRLQIWDCDSNNDNQKWTRSGETLVWNLSKFCLDVPQSKATAGVSIQIWNCNQTNAQKWDADNSNTVVSNPNTSTPSTGGSTETLLFSPYKDVTINTNWNTYVISSKVTGSLASVLDSVSGLPALTWSFATGECGSENWGGIAGADLAKANVSTWAASSTKYIVSTGGAAGAFTCSSDTGFSTFIDRYISNNLVGIDFDIEAGQTTAAIANLVQRVKTAQSNSKYAHLRFSFTIATLGGQATQSLNQTGINVINAIKAEGLTNYYINLMTMDFGAATSDNCILKSDGSCDMGQSSVQAARNLNTAYNIPLSQIEITPMIGGNDVQGETFTLDDVTTVMNFAKNNNIGGVHFWSLDRDTDCVSTWASPICNSYGKSGTLGFLKEFTK